MKIDEIIKEVKKVSGFFREDQMRAIYPFVREMNSDELLVEIGTLHGKSTRFFSLSNPKIKIVTIDALLTDNKDKIRIDKNILESGNIFQVIGLSKEISKGFNWLIDLLFIDGDHSYEATKNDFNSWSSFVKSGGYIIIHDYNSKYWPGVVQATDEYITNNESLKVLEDKKLHLCIIEKYG